MADPNVGTAPPATLTPDSDVAQERAARRTLIENSVTLLVFLALFAVFGIWLGAKFLNIDARLLDVHQNVPTLLLALAVLVAMIPGQFDLSVAGLATLCTFLTIGLTSREGWPLPVVIVITLSVGLLVGFVNGIMVEVLRVNAFIATLGMGAICAGAAKVYSGGSYVQPLPGGPQIPDWFSSFAAFASKVPSWLMTAILVGAVIALFIRADRVRPGRWPKRKWLYAKLAVFAVVLLLMLLFVDIANWVSSVSWLTFSLLVAAFVVWVLIQHTTFGRHSRAIGSNRPAAILAGVKVRRQVMKSFAVSSFIAAIAGIFLGAAQGSAAPDVAITFLLPAFAAAFLSTVILSDGRLTVVGTVLGGVFVVWVGLALILAGLPPTWLSIVNGVVLVGAVALSTSLRRAR